MMMHGRNNGKKLMTIRIVQHAFEIIHLLTGEVSPNASLFIQQKLMVEVELYICILVNTFNNLKNC